MAASTTATGEDFTSTHAMRYAPPSAPPIGRLPPDALQQEKDRMDIFHKLFLVARREALHQAPVVPAYQPRILDLGCGTGIWAIDMAE